MSDVDRIVRAISFGFLGVSFAISCATVGIGFALDRISKALREEHDDE